MSCLKACFWFSWGFGDTNIVLFSIVILIFFIILITPYYMTETFFDPNCFKCYNKKARKMDFLHFWAFLGQLAGPSLPPVLRINIPGYPLSSADDQFMLIVKGLHKNAYSYYITGESQIGFNMDGTNPYHKERLLVRASCKASAWTKNIHVCML